jgi:hypothetical protein
LRFRLRLTSCAGIVNVIRRQMIRSKFFFIMFALFN